MWPHCRSESQENLINHRNVLFQAQSSGFHHLSHTISTCASILEPEEQSFKNQSAGFGIISTKADAILKKLQRWNILNGGF